MPDTNTPDNISDRPAGVKLGVAAKLFLAFCIVILAMIVVAVVGAAGLRDARRTLGASQDSFERVSRLLEDATRSMENVGGAIADANVTLDATLETMKATSSRVNSLNSVDFPAVIAIGTIREALTAVAVGERTLLMRQLHDPKIREEQRWSITAAFTRASVALDQFAAVEPRLSADKRTAWNQFLESWGVWKEGHEELMAEFDTIDILLKSRARDGAGFEDASRRAFEIAFGKGQSARDDVNQKLDAVVTLISTSARDSARVAFNDTQTATSNALAARNRMTEAVEKTGGFKQQMDLVNAQVGQTADVAAGSIANADRARWIFIVCSALALAASILLILWTTRHLSLPMRRAAEQTGFLAKGILDRDVMVEYRNRSDEIGVLARSFGDMLQALREEVGIAGEMASGDFSGAVEIRGDDDQLGLALSEMMRITHDALTRVNRHVQQVTEGAGAISAASRALSVGASGAETALIEISSNTTEIGEQTHRNARNASLANEFAISSRQVAERGYAAVEEMVASMREIQASSAQIAQIVKLIDDIAFQTNLLALNAAVEAARAGRQGKGFSVVAEEVRNLASRSAKAAGETAALVEETVKRVENGSAIAMRTDAAFKEILGSAQKTAELYGEIAEASQEQSKSIDQIVQGLEQIDQATRENSRYASQTASAAQTLSKQSDELARMMVRFQLQGGGSDHRDAPRPYLAHDVSPPSRRPPPAMLDFS